MAKCGKASAGSSAAAKHHRHKPAKQHDKKAHQLWHLLARRSAAITYEHIFSMPIWNRSRRVHHLSSSRRTQASGSELPGHYSPAHAARHLAPESNGWYRNDNGVHHRWLVESGCVHPGEWPQESHTASSLPLRNDLVFARRCQFLAPAWLVSRTHLAGNTSLRDPTRPARQAESS